MLVHDLGVFALGIGSGLLGCAVRVGAVSRFEGGGTTRRASTRGADAMMPDGSRLRAVIPDMIVGCAADQQGERKSPS